MKREFYRISKIVLVFLFVLSLTHTLKAIGDISNGDTWVETYSSDPDINYSTPEELSTSIVRLDDTIGAIWFGIGFSVAIYQYQPEFDHNRVNLRLALYFDSIAAPPYYAVYAERVTVIAEKLNYLNYQKIEFQPNVGTTPYHQGKDLLPYSQNPYVVSNELMAFCAVPVLSWAVGKVAGDKAGLLVSYLLSAGSAMVTETPPDFDNAGWSSGDTKAYFWWMIPYLSNRRDVDQYCFNTLYWDQKRINPSPYIAMRIRVKIRIAGPNVGLFNSANYEMYFTFLIKHRGSTGGGGPRPTP